MGHGNLSLDADLTGYPFCEVQSFLERQSAIVRSIMYFIPFHTSHVIDSNQRIVVSNNFISRKTYLDRWELKNSTIPF